MSEGGTSNQGSSYLAYSLRVTWCHVVSRDVGFMSAGITFYRADAQTIDLSGD